MYLNDMECEMYGECGMYEMYLLETILVKGNFIYFMNKVCVHSKPDIP